jgi:hypothetical protein
MNERAASESMTKVVEPWALMIFRSAQADLPRQSIKSAVHGGHLQAAAVIVEQETW